MDKIDEKIAEHREGHQYDGSGLVAVLPTPRKSNRKSNRKSIFDSKGHTQFDLCGHVDRFGTESPKHLTRKFSGRSEAGPYPETVSLLTPVGEKPQVLVAESPS